MKLWALTGGIASGKSTTAAMFAAHGMQIVNADHTYHALISPIGGKPSPLAQKVAAAFDAVAVLLPDGSIDRAALGAHVFADRAARLRLESVTHPAIAAATAAQIAQKQKAGAQHLMYDVPLLFEKGLTQAFLGVVVIWVSAQTQLTRLLARDGLAPRAAQARLATQVCLQTKRRRATWVVDNSGTRDASAQQVENIWQHMQQPHGPDHLCIH